MAMITIHNSGMLLVWNKIFSAGTRAERRQLVKSFYKAGREATLHMIEEAEKQGFDLRKAIERYCFEFEDTSYLITKYNNAIQYRRTQTMKEFDFFHHNDEICNRDPLYGGDVTIVRHNTDNNFLNPLWISRTIDGKPIVSALIDFEEAVHHKIQPNARIIEIIRGLDEETMEQVRRKSPEEQKWLDRKFCQEKERARKDGTLKYGGVLHEAAVYNGFPDGITNGEMSKLKRTDLELTKKIFADAEALANSEPKCTRKITGPRMR